MRPEEVERDMGSPDSGQKLRVLVAEDERLAALWRLGTGPGEMGVVGASMELLDDCALRRRMMGTSAGRGGLSGIPGGIGCRYGFQGGR